MIQFHGKNLLIVLQRGDSIILIRKLPGPIGRARGIKIFIDTWTSLFDESMLEIIVNYTRQYIDCIKDTFLRERDSKHIDKTELKALIGLLYIAGVHKAEKLNLEELWDINEFGVKIFRLTMSLKRFRFLLRVLKFDDRETRQERQTLDRLAPNWEIFDKFVTNCQQCYYVGENVMIDEKLEAFRGRCNFIQSNLYYIIFHPCSQNMGLKY